MYVAPATQGAVQLHYTIPDLLDLGCAYGYTPALHHWSSQGWKTSSYQEFRTATEEFALGLRSQAGLLGETSAGADRVGLLLDNDIDWALVDVGSLLGGWVTVPIDTGQSADAIGWMVKDADLRVLVVANWKTLERVYDQIQSVPLIVMVDGSAPPDGFDSMAQDHAMTTLDNIRRQGRRQRSPEAIQALKDAIHADDLATIVYTADATGMSKGVMLSHRSLTGNIWAAFSSMPGLVRGTREVALLFLPLNHIFARTFLYGHLGFGHDIYFSSPKRVFRHLALVKPTIFITVPRLLEKVYERVNGVRQQSSGLKRLWLGWGWHWAHRYPASRHGQGPGSRLQRWLLGHGQGPGSRLQRWFLGHGVFGHVRQAFGGNMRYLLSGGAALRPEVMTFFNAVGIPVQQGYGLTETSSVLSYTRDRWFRSGTVGAPIPGVEMRLGTDGEVLVKSVYTMEGYHHNPAATHAVIDSDGWFHTGDWGEFSEDGLLTLHGCKKGLFKLSTGKYVAPAPIEAQLERSPWVKQAWLVGPGQKFCGVLIVPEGGIGGEVRSHLHTLIDQVNTALPHWSTIKRFVLVEAKGLPQGNREQLYQMYAQEIEELYRDGEPGPPREPGKMSRLRGRWRRLEASWGVGSR
ncbi:AMP-dependent synthetase/ligase [Leptothoe sp. PORK10 BA2]|uniref:AMP-dependent synthetase/ligase n=1 Tax=Leptothoe sp. PORK10 BA2 TaxID=3110254 RepID=UPI002B21F21A|nr:AMP-binding protein [Leptothoe sp. PORK10 BA2]MEA5466894.1 AMP-binding protein [Leptothoe sp. PORK10 BA2]